MRTLCILLAALVIAAPASAEARSILVGTSDTGDARDFNREAERIGFRFPTLQTFHAWGNGLDRASGRWRKLGVIPALHISTADDETGREIITPREIAEGAGDLYLLELNRSLNELGAPSRVRPLAEPNRAANPYSAFSPGGIRRGESHTPACYRKAFRRIYLILHGGSVPRINRILHVSGMPSISGDVGSVLPNPDVKVIWSPLPSNLGIRGNSPQVYWPGRHFYDIAGTSFYSFQPNWKLLTRFYRKYSASQRRSFSLAEWGLNHDSPGFTWRVFRWCLDRKLCESLYYYRGFNSDSYGLENFPRSSEVLIKILRRPIFPQG